MSPFKLQNPVLDYNINLLSKYNLSKAFSISVKVWMCNEKSHCERRQYCFIFGYCTGRLKGIRHNSIIFSRICEIEKRCGCLRNNVKASHFFLHIRHSHQMFIWVNNILSCLWKYLCPQEILGDVKKTPRIFKAHCLAQLCALKLDL